MRKIHPTALIDPRAELADDVSVGAYTIIKGKVVVSGGTCIEEHCHIHGDTIIGSRCRIGPAAYLGLPPQHLKHDGNGSFLVIGDDVIVREMASAHRAITPGLEHATRIGDRCMLMVGSHLGHDGIMGTDVILANGVQLGGHVKLGDRAFMGGGAVVHQFVSIGRLAIVSGNEAVTHDLPPFAAMRYCGLKGYNAVGCRRSGMSRRAIAAVRSAFHSLHTHRMLPTALAEIRQENADVPEIQEFLTFVAASKRGILRSLRFTEAEREVDDPIRK